MKFTESRLEAAIADLLGKQGYPHALGETLPRSNEEVLLAADLESYLRQRYAADGITGGEIQSVIRQLTGLPASDLYGSNVKCMRMLTDGLPLRREDRSQKDLHIQLLDTAHPARNIFRFVTQMEISGFERRIPDGILYANGLPLVVMEFKSAIREEATLHDAFTQLTTRYRRDIPELLKYNAFCVISDGANTKAGSLFAPYEFWYAWRRVTSSDAERDGIGALESLIAGMLAPERLVDIVTHFIYLPDTSSRDEKIVCRYPQYYAARALFDSIRVHQRPEGDGKGGTYFGTTGCGKSYTMLFLTRLLMRSAELASPTIVLITDRTDLDSQLSEQFTNAKKYIGDHEVESVESRADLRSKLRGRKGGGVFLTTIHKFTEDTELLTDRTNVICISDEAHRSQINLEQKVRVTEDGVKKSFGFAKYLHDSLPNATYVGFTGTPIDATLDVFGPVVDSYTMTESVKDEITVPIVYEGRAARVLLDNTKLREIENYYADCLEQGANEHQVEESKRQAAKMEVILGDADRIRAVAEDFVHHYEARVREGASVKGKALFVCSTRQIAYDLYRQILKLRPVWGDVLACEEDASLTEREEKEIKPMPRLGLVMTRGKDDPADLWDLLGTKDDRKELDRQFKNEKSNFKIAIVVDMWLTGFDVPFLDTIYIDKPIQKHSLIQTISRVNRRFAGKPKGLVVDYIGIKRAMNLALAQYNKLDKQNFEDIDASLAAVRDQLELLEKIFHGFDKQGYFTGAPAEQLSCLNRAVEHVQRTHEIEKRFFGIVRRLKAAYDICAGNEALSQDERDLIHFYLAVRAILRKLTKGEAPDSAQMNVKVKELIEEAILSEGVEEIFALGSDEEREIDLFDEDYLAKLDRIKLPNTKIKLLQKLLAKAIGAFQKTNRAKGIEFAKRMQALVEKYNERKESDTLRSEVLEEFTTEIIDLYHALQKEKGSFADLGIDFEEKAFYDILKMLTRKYDFAYPDDRLLELARAVKEVVDDAAKYTDWNRQENIKAELKANLIVLLAEFEYPPVDRDEVYGEIFEQAESFKRSR